jgi:polysaccharide biosynthesis/export protein
MLAKIDVKLTMINNQNLKQLMPKLTQYLLAIGFASFTPYLPGIAGTPATTTAPTPAPKVAPTGPAENNDYTLGGGDRVRVTVFQVAELSGDYLVLPDGNLTLPLAGSINVEGKTVTQVSQELTKRYANYLKRPVVTVSLLTPRPLQIAVAGEVNNPGTYTIAFGQNPEQTLKAPLLTDLLRKAGGVTTVADVGQVQVRRTINGQERIFESNLWELIQKGDKKQDISLRDGDSIFIPTKANVDVGQTRQLADANFGIDSDREVTVTIVGEVNRPGAYRIIPTQTNSANPEEGGTGPPNPGHPTGGRNQTPGQRPRDRGASLQSRWLSTDNPSRSLGPTQ